jgi:thymidylate synthase
MNKLDLDYQNLLKDILENGTKKETRNGGTISVFGRQIRHKMSEGFPVITTKKMAWKTMVTELIYNGGDVHLYLNHIEPIKEQLTREPYSLPTVKLSDRDVNDISEYTLHDITLEGYQSHPTIKLPLSN